MKNLFFSLCIIGAALLSCRGNDDGLLQIDQVVKVYIDSAGIDMLNPNKTNAYTSVSANDINGIRDTAPVSLSLKFDKDSIKYIDYVAGARRILIDSSDVNAKVYQSKMKLIFTKKIDETKTSTFSDTLILNYVKSSNVFRIEKAWYNRNVVFSKSNDPGNTIKVTK